MASAIDVPGIISRICLPISQIKTNISFKFLQFPVPVLCGMEPVQCPIIYKALFLNISF